jgi:alpha-D-xyloside xylohydrolase
VGVLRFFTRLKCRLMPYLFAAAWEAHETGVPMLRAMLLEFPGDPACDYLDRQYMLGAALLVAPVFRADGGVDYYLPAGRWTHFLTGAVLEGGGWRREQHAYLSLPLLARPNSVIPVGAREDRPDYDYADGVTLHIFALDDGVTCRAQIPALRGPGGLMATVRREGQVVTVNLPEADKPWRVLLRGMARVQSVAGGAAATDPLGIGVTPDQGVDRVTIHLDSA